MNVFERLPTELQQRIFYYLSHPTADMIIEKVRHLNLDKQIELLTDTRELIIELDMRELFDTEYFHAYKHFKKYKSYDNYEFISSVDIMTALIGDDTSSESSTDYSDSDIE